MLPELEQYGRLQRKHHRDAKQDPKVTGNYEAFRASLDDQSCLEWKSGNLMKLN